MSKQSENTVRAVSLAVLMLCSIIVGGVTFTGSVAADHPDVDVSDLEGNGTEADPYVITTAPELQAMEDDPSANYTLGNDIDASGTAQWNGGSGFNPVGGGFDDFSGSLDGNGHSIDELTIDRPEVRAGLFAEIDISGMVTDVSLTGATVTGTNGGILAGTSYGTIRNVTASGNVTGTSRQPTGVLTGLNIGLAENIEVSGSVTASGERVGGLAGGNEIGSVNGEFTRGIIRNATASVSVNASGERVGGLVGDNGGTVENATASGDVTGINATSVTGGVGGLIGINDDDGIVQDVRASGSVTGTDASTQVGGLIGRNEASTQIRNATASGSVTGDEQVGGLVGRNTETVRNATASGNVTGNASVGGLVGRNLGEIQDTFAVGPVSGSTNTGGSVGRNFGTVTNSYWDTETTGQADSAGNTTGLTTDKMQGEVARNNMAGLDFETTWQTQPDDYPTLQALPQDASGAPDSGDDSGDDDNTGSPLDGTAGEYDSNGDGTITASELGSAVTDFGQGEVTASELGEVVTAFGQS